MAKRRRGYELLDAKRVFSDVLSNTMVEQGFDYDKYTVDEIHETIRTCIDEAFGPTWDEFSAWVMYGDDKKAMTMGIIRSQIRSGMF